MSKSGEWFGGMPYVTSSVNWEPASPDLMRYLAEAVEAGTMTFEMAGEVLRYPEHWNPRLDTLHNIVESQFQVKTPPQPQPKENTSMIEVAKIVLSTRVKYGRPFGGHTSPSKVPQETAKVSLGLHGVSLDLRVDDSDDEADKVVSLTMPPEKAVLLAQTIMKAAESQVEYATKARELAEERVKLDETFKERISGLALTGPTAEDMLVVHNGSTK